MSTGQYGVDDLYVGVPVVIGAGGVEQIVEIALDDEAKANLAVSVDAVKELLVACKGDRREPEVRAVASASIDPARPHNPGYDEDHAAWLGEQVALMRAGHGRSSMPQT